MEIIKELLENAIGFAEECRLLTHNHEGLRIHVQYIQDLTKTLVRSGYQVAFTDENKNGVYALAMKTLKNLQSGVLAAKPGTSLPIVEMQAELEKRSGRKLPSFDGKNSYEFIDFLDSFLAVVDSYDDTSDVIKLILLKNCLKGAAFDLVSVLQTSTRNYRQALILLNTVYEDFSCGKITKLYHSMVALPQVCTGDGAEFRRTFWKLESILESMKTSGIQINDDSYLRSVYLRKFSEETLISVLVKNSDLSLSNIRAEIHRMVYLQELNSQIIEEKPADKPISECGISDAVSGDQKAVSNSVENDGNESAESVQSSEDSDQVDGDGHFITTLSTVCALVSYRTKGGRKNSTIVRILLQNIPPVSLLSEDAAKRLGINFCGQKKSLRLKGTLGNTFTATETAFKLTLDLGNGDSECIKVHIVDDKYGYAGYVMPGIDVADFKKEHPHLSHLDLADTGAGRPLDLFLSGDYWCRYLSDYGMSRSDCPPVKDGWHLLPSRFGLLLNGGRVKTKSKYLHVCSFHYDN